MVHNVGMMKALADTAKRFGVQRPPQTAQRPPPRRNSSPPTTTHRDPPRAALAFDPDTGLPVDANPAATAAAIVSAGRRLRGIDEPTSPTGMAAQIIAAGAKRRNENEEQ